MTDTALVILIAYTTLSIIGIAIGLIIFRSTRVGFRVRASSRRTLEQRETYWGLAVITFLVVVLAGTMFSLPYWDAESKTTEQKLEITGRQFAWTVNPPRARAGVPTLMVVRAVDVSHGVGVYGPDDTLLRQVNVVPGVTQEFVMTFDRPGKYELRCLEFCGVDHHLMQNTLEVTR
jgi:cytochrome c oxidase subunit 2